MPEVRIVIPPGGRPTRMAEYTDAHAHSFTRAELTAAWSRHQLDACLLAGTVARVLPGVYAGVRHAAEPLVWAEAVTTWAPRALVTGELALHLYEVTLPPPGHADVVTARGDRLHPPSWVRVHQAGIPAASGAPCALRCTVPERALLDAWRFALPSRRVNVFYQSLWSRVCTWRQLRRELDRTPRVTGRRELERLLGEFAAGATSPLEVKARRDVFTGQEFRIFEWQAPLVVGSRRIVADLLQREARVVVELDGGAYHDGGSAVSGDRRRDVDLAAAGYVTMRFGWDDITRRAPWCRARVLEAVARRDLVRQ